MGIDGTSKLPKIYRNDFKHNIVAFGGGLKCPRKIHLNTLCSGGRVPLSDLWRVFFGNSCIYVMSSSFFDIFQGKLGTTMAESDTLFVIQKTIVSKYHQVH